MGFGLKDLNGPYYLTDPSKVPPYGRMASGHACGRRVKVFPN